MKTITLRFPHGPRGATRRVQDIRRVSIDGDRLCEACTDDEECECMDNDCPVCDPCAEADKRVKGREGGPAMNEGARLGVTYRGPFNCAHCGKGHPDTLHHIHERNTWFCDLKCHREYHWPVDCAFGDLAAAFDVALKAVEGDDKRVGRLCQVTNGMHDRAFKLWAQCRFDQDEGASQ